MRPLFVDRRGARFLVLLGLACLLLLPSRAPAAGDGDEATNTRLLIGGDVIIAADGQPVTSRNDLNRFLRTKRPGESVVLTMRAKARGAISP